MKTNIIKKIKNKFYKLLLVYCIRKVDLDIGIYESRNGHILIQSIWCDDDIIETCKQNNLLIPIKIIRKEILQEAYRLSNKGYTIDSDLFIDIMENKVPQITLFELFNN